MKSAIGPERTRRDHADVSNQLVYTAQQRKFCIFFLEILIISCSFYDLIIKLEVNCGSVVINDVDDSRALFLFFPPVRQLCHRKRCASHEGCGR